MFSCQMYKSYKVDVLTIESYKDDSEERTRHDGG